MKKLVLLTLTLFLASAGIFAQKAGKVDTTTHEKFYSCPTHPQVTSHEPGKCSECGMQLTLSAKEEMKSKDMKTYSCPVHTDIAKHDPGACPKCGKKLMLSAKEQMKAGITKLYTCPMHPEVALDKEGNCPKCGKTLVKKESNN